jgi:hypothetical protein
VAKRTVKGGRGDTKHLTAWNIKSLCKKTAFSTPMHRHPFVDPMTTLLRRLRRGPIWFDSTPEDAWLQVVMCGRDRHPAAWRVLEVPLPKWVKNGPDGPETPLPVDPINGHRPTGAVGPVRADFVL